ncbi:MAG: phospholipase D-like domain-containing protein [Gammaproteobacteria bacterium]
MSISLLSSLLLILNIALASLVAGHALLTKSDPRAALGWVSLAFLTPLIGSALYFIFGINRITTRARRLASKSPFESGQPAAEHSVAAAHITPTPCGLKQGAQLAQVARKVTGKPLLSGNAIKCLHNGENAYPVMLAAIANARRTLFLTTYIFETRQIGTQFIDALVEATQRGVDVRVIIDGVGELTNIPRASTLLQRRGVKVGRFLPPRLIPPSLSINLRNHRKILAIDSEIAFTGGMNITAKHLADDTSNPKRMTDVHFQFQGPIVCQIEQSFLEDWAFVTDDRETVESTHCEQQGDAYCRIIPDGPNEYLDQLNKVISGVLCCAQQRIGIVSPYFLPPRDLTIVLRAAALRGVDIHIILPAVSDNPLVQWATRHILSFLLEDGIQFYLQPAPFNHSKLLVVDDYYALIGSANMDPRSLRLNFELGVEIFDQQISQELWTHITEIMAKSSRIQHHDLTRRNVPQRLRDALAWVCSPYL